MPRWLKLLLLPWWVLWRGVVDKMGLEAALLEATELARVHWLFRMVGFALGGVGAFSFFSATFLSEPYIGHFLFPLFGFVVFGGVGYWGWTTFWASQTRGYFQKRVPLTVLRPEALRNIFLISPWFFWWVLVKPLGLVSLLLLWWHRRVAFEKQAGLSAAQSLEALFLLWLTPLIPAAVLLWLGRVMTALGAQ